MDNMELLNKINELGDSRAYRPLTDKLKEEYYALYLTHMNGFDSDSKRDLKINDVLFAKDYIRVVVGDYGAYVEIEPKDLLVKIDIAKGQEWRLDKVFLEKRSINIKYEWYDYLGKKVYLQKDTVKYADYKPGYYYISVLYFDNVVESNYKWSRISDNNYEVSTKGDKRYSALVAKLEDGRTIEEVYQLDIKGYRKFSNDWKFGKGKKPLRDINEEQLFEEYKNLWKTYFNENPNLLEEISILAKDKVLTDMFAYTGISQARAIAEILNEKIGEDKMVVNDKDLEKSLLELNKLSLHRINKAERTSSLKWGFRKGYPRLMVFINGSDLSVRGRDNMIIAPFGFTALNTLTGAMAEIIEAEKGTEFSINCINAKFVDNKKTDETIVQATVVVGKDQDGMIFISLSEESKPTVRFNLTLNEEWNPVTMNGVNIGLTEFGSKMFTKRYLNQVETVYNSILAATTTYKTEENIV